MSKSREISEQITDEIMAVRRKVRKQHETVQKATAWTTHPDGGGDESALDKQARKEWREQQKAKSDLEYALDPRTKQIVDGMPAWHQDINRQALIPLYGQKFRFFCIDPQYPNRIVLEINDPTRKG